jgi:hypothetical protein
MQRLHDAHVIMRLCTSRGLGCPNCLSCDSVHCLTWKGQHIDICVAL